VKRLVGYIRRHPRLVAGSAVVLLAGIALFTLRSVAPAHAAAGAPHASASSTAVASTSSPAGPAPHSAFTILARYQHPRVAGGRRAASARTGASGQRVAAALTRAPGRQGLRTPPPTAAALSLGLRQATGLSPAQVTSRAVCPPAGAGQATCAAQALVLRSNGSLVHPHVRPAATIGRVRPAEGSSA
jgi:hypothetical protein